MRVKKKQRLFSIITTLFMMVTITFSGMTGIVKADTSSTITPTSWAYSVHGSTGDWTLNNGDTLDLTNSALPDQADKTIRVTSGTATIKGGCGKTFTNLAIEISGGANLTIKNLNIDNRVWGSGAKSPIAVMDDNTGNTLSLNGTNELYAADNQAAVSVAEVNSLTIISNADGGVTAIGGYGGAGIGGGANGTGGTISILGGTVTARGGLYGSGIGGGEYGAGGSISITGGTVTATGEGYGAAIGGGIFGAGGSISITGGIVTATEVLSGAGIGGGGSGAGGNINITGGTVTAIGGDSGSGVGGGYSGAGGNINITGGTVTATGGFSGAGIGGGGSGAGGNISITGGTVTATGGDSGSGVGGGYNGATGTLKIASGVSDIPIVKAYGINANAIVANLTGGTDAYFICCKASPSPVTNDTGMGINLTNINNPAEQVTLNLPKNCTSFATTVNANANYNIITTETPARRSICKTDDSNIFSSQHNNISFIDSKIVSNIPPTATDVNITGAPNVGQTLIGHYTYNDADGDTVGNSTYKWYRADDASGLNKTEIALATSNTYVFTSADQGKYISFEVIPVATTGAKTGVAVSSAAIIASYTITYDSQGATNNADPTTQSVTYGATTILPTNPIKTGYTFGGWYTAINGGGTNFNSFTPIYDNITVYAKWNNTPSSPIIYYNTSYSVIYDGNGNTSGYVAVASVSYQQGTTVTVLGNGGNLTKAGYTFAGWNTKSDGTGTNYAVGDKFVIGSSNVTLYANWIKKYIPENIKYVLIGDYAYNIKALFDASKKAEIMNAINSQNGNKIYYKINGKILSINGSLTNDDKTYLKGLKVNYEGDSDFSVPENDIQ